jgi:uncharacterized repeat protein (TIGR03803 family)
MIENSLTALMRTTTVPTGATTGTVQVVTPDRVPIQQCAVSGEVKGARNTRKETKTMTSKTNRHTRLARMASAIFVLTAAATSLPAQTLTKIVNFDGGDGYRPNAGLIQGTDGNLYGTTTSGGTNNYGTVFKIRTGGAALTTLHNFCSLSGCTDGYYPYAALVQATNGNLYGTTNSGGTNGGGTIFMIAAHSDRMTTVYNFCSQTGCADGEVPTAGLIQAANGDLYGTTSSGGADGDGTVFQLSLSGALTTIASFDGTDGASPNELVQASDGYLYGTTSSGGAFGYGTVFKISTGGALTLLYSFCSQETKACLDGSAPNGPLVEASDGDLYGTTLHGGAHGGGTIFRITPGTLTTLYSFCSQTGCTDGKWPCAGLIQATDGNLYGTTNSGEDYTYGTIFKITPDGTLTTLVTFGGTDGGGPLAAPVQDTNGDFYGTTWGGGSGFSGTVFNLSVGLGPLVKTLPLAGKAATPVGILGTDLTGATSVTFNGVAAVFSVESPTLITTTVPAGATTGTVQVVTPTGTLSSNVPFQVK